jgi:hypothetical protein
MEFSRIPRDLSQFRQKFESAGSEKFWRTSVPTEFLGHPYDGTNKAASHK